MSGKDEWHDAPSLTFVETLLSAKCLVQCEKQPGQLSSPLLLHTAGQEANSNLPFWQSIWSILPNSSLLSLLQPCGECCVGSASWADTCLFYCEIHPLSKYTTTLLWSQGTFKLCRMGGCSLWSLKPNGGCWVRATVPQSSTLSLFGQHALNREVFEDL